MDEGMANIYLAVGSVTGTANAVAATLKKDIEAAGHTVVVDQQASLVALNAQEWDALLVCTSTTGRGNVPQNLREFYNELDASHSLIPAIKYGIVALGSSAHTNFCGAGASFEALLEDSSAQCLVPKVTIDATETKNPDRDATFWLKEFLAAL
jgi:flavodoxin